MSELDKRRERLEQEGTNEIMKQAQENAKKKRVVEMYIGTSETNSDYGTWGTDYVEIPRNTPEDKIEETATAQAKEDFAEKGFIFVGVYSIPSLEDSDEIMEYED